MNCDARQAKEMTRKKGEAAPENTQQDLQKKAEDHEETGARREALLDSLFEEFSAMTENLAGVPVQEIPRIDLYMDQVLTFMEEHLSSDTRDPEHDKILTKTMINNYVKNDVLIPPVRKKYGMDHMVLLLIIFYLKSFLSIGDIQKVVAPLEGQEEPLESIYRRVYETMGAEKKVLLDETRHQFDRAAASFPDSEELQRFSLIARMAMEIYLKKLFIERLLDEEERRSAGTGKDKDTKDTATK